MQALCSKPPHLPGKQLQMSTMPPEAALLDRLFRLEREGNLVGPVRAELAALNIKQQPGAPAGMTSHAEAPPTRPTTRALPPASAPQQPSNLHPNGRHAHQLYAIQGSTVRPRPCLLVQVQLPASHPSNRIKQGTTREAVDRVIRQRMEYWSTFGKAFLPQDALVCIVRGNRLLAFATVVRRKLEELAQPLPVVGLQMQEQYNMAAFLELSGQQQPLFDTYIVQVCTAGVKAKTKIMITD
eukprot:91965-Pelagomonas_calceolata.AAC.4